MPTSTRRLITAGATAALLVTVTIALPAQATGDIGSSYRQARALLDSAIATHGGVGALRGLTRLRVRIEGQDHWRNQSRRVEPPYDTEPWTGDLWLDLARSRMVWTNTSRFPGGFRNGSRTVIDGTQGFNANLIQRQHVNVPGRTVEGQRAVLVRLPHWVLLEALTNAAGLRSVGPVRLSDGTPVAAIATAAGGAQLTLGIDPGTKELRALLGVQGDPLAGDAATETVFSDYRRAGGVLFPGRRVSRVAGEITQDVRYLETEVDATIPDSLLVPPGTVEIRPPAPAADTTVELGREIWAIRSAGYWSLVVGFPEYLVVVETPGAGVPTTIAKARTLGSNRPIRYAVPTHHHDDHAGGARHFMAVGATILTTAGNRSYFERMAGAHSTLRPDSLSANPRPPRIETFAQSRTISAGGRTLELHDIGPSPHAVEIVVAWLPTEGILFQGDLLNLPPDGTVSPATANATTVHFSEWLAQRGWRVQTLAGVHMVPSPPSRLDEAMAARAPE